MSRALIVGAGAEVDLGFKSGPSFIQDTFYCQKNALYRALNKFYAGRLGKNCDDAKPTKYEPAFLFNSNGRAFKDLVQNLARDNSAFVFDLLGKSLEDIRDVSKYPPADFKNLFDHVIVEGAASQKSGVMVDSIPKDSHFGILEQYYSELLKPNAHLVRFWKLLNFYWSAFFSIATPITDSLYDGKRSYEENKYEYTLEHLNDVISVMFSDGHIKQTLGSESYYSALRGKADWVLTTNYTPYAAAIVDGNESQISWLSGKLSQFEHLPDLEFVDYSLPGHSIKPNDFVFPYLLCQSPVKPVISLAQVDEYAKASEALRNSDEIAVLGYSFCKADAHICSMVGESMRSNDRRKLVYFSYVDKDSEFNKEEIAVDLQKKLRVAQTIVDNQIEILQVSDFRSAEFVERCEAWA